MRIPIILISTEGKTKKQFLKECGVAINNFLKAKRKVDQERFHQETEKLNELSRKNPQPLIDWLIDSEQIKEEKEDSSEKLSKITDKEFFKKGKSYQILEQKNPK